MKARAIRIGIAVLLLGLAGMVAITLAQGDGPTEEHQTITEYTGPETCATCHPDAPQQVAESLHYQQQGDAPFREGWEEDKLGGMYVTY